MGEVIEQNRVALQGVEKELAGARDQVLALQEELLSQVIPAGEAHVMDCTLQGDSGEPAVLEVDTCDDQMQTGESVQVNIRGVV